MSDKNRKMIKQLRVVKWSLLIFVFLMNVSCSSAQPKIDKKEQKVEESIQEADIVLGNERLSEYLTYLENKRVAIVGNHTSLIGKTHLVDSLLTLGVNVVKVFSPEHGFRGVADAGEKVSNEIDAETGLQIISLYGNNKKPSVQQLSDVDVLLFDIQDVGVRFYTYISTLHYVMEAAAEQKKKVIVLDKPNPNGHYVDGPILEQSQKSFVGMHPVPVVHGMTIGEYANMINGESWLKNDIKADLTVISCENYTHQKVYKLEKAPSPNLPNMKSIYLYPSLCFFEGTPISIGRGTNKPFQQIGHPSIESFSYHFIPQSNVGAKNPKLKGKKCFGLDLSETSEEELKKWNQLNFSFLIQFYHQYPQKDKFFTNFFNLLAGNKSLQEDIIAEKTELEIRNSWKEGLEMYHSIRNKYLLYD